VDLAANETKTVTFDQASTPLLDACRLRACVADSALQIRSCSQVALSASVNTARLDHEGVQFGHSRVTSSLTRARLVEGDGLGFVGGEIHVLTEGDGLERAAHGRVHGRRGGVREVRLDSEGGGVERRGDLATDVRARMATLPLFLRYTVLAKCRRRESGGAGSNRAS